MENIASTARDDSKSIVDAIMRGGNADIAAPLQLFLEKSENTAALRAAAQIVRPALKADIAHFLNSAYGRVPGVVDHAGSKVIAAEARSWFAAAADSFATERALMQKLTVAAGPIHRPEGHGKVQALVTAQARSIEMLACSDRNGCALGAAIAFVLDWAATRPLLDRVARDLGVAAPASTLPDAASCAALIDMMDSTNAVQRAMAFGSEQMLGQMRGLWKLIAARHEAMMAL